MTFLEISISKQTQRSFLFGRFTYLFGRLFTFFYLGNLLIRSALKRLYIKGVLIKINFVDQVKSWILHPSASSMLHIFGLHCKTSAQKSLRHEFCQQVFFYTNSVPKRPKEKFLRPHKKEFDYTYLRHSYFKPINPDPHIAFITVFLLSLGNIIIGRKRENDKHQLLSLVSCDAPREIIEQR